MDEDRVHGVSVLVGVNAFVTVPDGFADAEAFCRTVVEEASVVLAPGHLFGFPDRFRIGFGLPTDELEEGLDRVGGVIAEHAPPTDSAAATGGDA